MSTDEYLTSKTYFQPEFYFKFKIQIPFALIDSYINYANIAWASTNKAYLERILEKLKQDARTISIKDSTISLRFVMK